MKEVMTRSHIIQLLRMNSGISQRHQQIAVLFVFITNQNFQCVIFFFCCLRLIISAIVSVCSHRRVVVVAFFADARICQQQAAAEVLNTKQHF